MKTGITFYQAIVSPLKDHPFVRIPLPGGTFTSGSCIPLLSPLYEIEFRRYDNNLIYDSEDNFYIIQDWNMIDMEVIFNRIIDNRAEQQILSKKSEMLISSFSETDLLEVYCPWKETLARKQASLQSWEIRWLKEWNFWVQQLHPVNSKDITRWRWAYFHGFFAALINMGGIENA